MVTRALAAAAAVLLGGCERFASVKGTPVAPLARPVVVMHRGGGQLNPDLRENTLPAIRYGAGLYDGAEVDLQLSASGTIWLGHDNEVRDCSRPGVEVRAGEVVGCFQDLEDAEIDAVAHCDAATSAPCLDRGAPTCVEHHVRLAEVLEAFATEPALLQKILVLDVKHQLCGSTGLPEARELADALHALEATWQLGRRLVVESDQGTFMRRFKDNGTPAHLFAVGYGGIEPIVEDAARMGATGISYRYTNEPLDPAIAEGLRAAGLRVMVWPVPEPIDGVEHIPAVWAMRPDVIATDRPDFLDHVEPGPPF